jgi:hypothetical protein
MHPLRDSATEALRDLLTAQPTTEAKVLFAWRMAAGPSLSRAAHAEWTDGKLRLLPATAAWRKELLRARPVLLERLRHWLGAEVIQGIVIESSSEAERFPHA